MKFNFIFDHRLEFSVTFLCKVLDVSKSGYQVWRKRSDYRSKKATAELALMRTIEDIHTGSRKIYGSPKIAALLASLPQKCSRTKVARLMKKYGLRSRTKRAFRKTTDSSHSLKLAPNHLGQDFKAYHPNQLWAGDITYIQTSKGTLYLATVIDLFSRKIVGWRLDSHMRRSLVMEAFESAFSKERPEKNFIFHSDKGSQYASRDFRKLLARRDCIQSMSSTGNCWDNSMAESFFASLKKELVYLERFKDREHAERRIFEWIEIEYNRERPHSSLGYLSPVKFEEVHFMKKAA